MRRQAPLGLKLMVIAEVVLDWPAEYSEGQEALEEVAWPQALAIVSI